LLYPDPSESVIDCYDADYLDRLGDARLASIVRETKIQTFDRILTRAIRKRTPGRLLDLGCALGYCMDAAVSLGWDAYGLDINPIAVARARERHGSKVWEGRIEEVDELAGTFDVVIATDVIEHTWRPKSAVLGCRKILRPGGLVVLTTVNASSMSCRIMGKAWPHYNKEHLCYFNPANISTLLSESGFTVVEYWNTMKVVCAGYCLTVLDTQNTPVFAPIARSVRRFMPLALQRFPISFPMGEFTIVGQLIEADKA